MPIVLFEGTFPFTWIVFVLGDEPVFNRKEIFAYSQVMVLVGLTFQPCCCRPWFPQQWSSLSWLGILPGCGGQQNTWDFFDSPGIWGMPSFNRIKSTYECCYQHNSNERWAGGWLNKSQKYRIRYGKLGTSICSPICEALAGALGVLGTGDHPPGFEGKGQRNYFLCLKAVQISTTERTIQVFLSSFLSMTDFSALLGQSGCKLIPYTEHREQMFPHCAEL